MAWGQPDPQAIVRASIGNYERAWRATASWAWTETEVSLTDDEKDVSVSEMVPLDGTPWERQIMKNGRPLTPEEQRRENRKFERAQKQRQNETPSERAARIRKYDQERAFAKNIAQAYEFKLLGEETIDGRPAWVIGLTPRSDFVATEPHASMLRHFDGKLWIDKEDLQWVKAEARAVDTVSMGWIVARIERGTHFTLEQTRVANDLWMPKRLTVKGVVRVMMVYNKNLNEDITYSGYHHEKQIQADK